MLAVVSAAVGTYHKISYASGVLVVEPVKACVIARDVDLTDAIRARFADCLGWQVAEADITSLCHGHYQPITITPLAGEGEVRIMADEVSFYTQGRSRLTGNVEVQEAERVVSAQTAYVYRDAKSNKVTKIELLGEVHYMEPERLMLARKATIYPQDKSGKVEDVLYRFNFQRHGAVLPAWGRASLIERFANKDYRLEKATYSNCAPQDKAWQIEAERITLDDAKATGVARHAKLRIYDWPVLYAPYFSFPTSRERKSGFLMPVFGSSNIGGFDYAQPYYWNIAPNYDATITPHLYSRRGLMMEGQFRYLTPYSSGVFNGRILPDDQAFKKYLFDQEVLYPRLKGLSDNRWSFQMLNNTQLLPNLHLGINFQQVSDDYFLQDFSSNLAVLTERQLLREAKLIYTTDHWLLRGMVQSYQTLHPVNQTPIEDVYQRLPQLMANGTYSDLPLNGNLSILGQFDRYQWPVNTSVKPQGSRYHLNPVLALPQIKPWGYITPSVEVVENYYGIGNNNYASYNDSNPINNYGFPLQTNNRSQQFNRTIPRYSIDSGLYFERSLPVFGKSFTQTLEPRLYYLYVPYHDQTPIPVFDSGYMIFNYDQLFRKNRFSGFDRIGDANQVAYALSSQWLSEETGEQKASFSIGQLRYFANRRVKLCQSSAGYCVDNPLALGYLPPDTDYSPVTARALYRFNPAWVLTGDYIWNVSSNSTDNAHLNFHYEPELNHIVNIGYSYLANGDITKVAFSNVQDNALNQLSFSYAWPFNEQWSSLGAYNYNISKRYEMLSLLGVQYDSCCWAVRLMAGRSFQSLDSQARPRYNNNVFFQILLKGLGSAGNSDPSSTINTFIPGYLDTFHNS
ncbi:MULTISPECIES: LPS-assembly protein LptD [unclassified Legionella]|uniref:LPS-assembly protein LptD n=1 Tax=unclassified Legionella TaxID=2622702 RepID=UPI001056121A|nr:MULTISPECIES: LPS-assembly protein LptD [unclassified Legionella]MDI9819369.1 LPS-assembly protein LptD [Legionella sp. PL877]